MTNANADIIGELEGLCVKQPYENSTETSLGLALVRSTSYLL